ncbi:hypothetical protein J6590_029086 [Homalodisca vitripennis]|nr:hypothetical protein J6590_029086 [Homalodisca vitripennis]
MNIKQGCPTYGPRAESGPRTDFTDYGGGCRLANRARVKHGTARGAATISQMAGACRARKVVSKLDSPTCQNIFRDQVDKRLCKSKACRCENALVARPAPTPVVGSGTSQKAESPKSGLNFSRLNPSDVKILDRFHKD